MKITIVGIDLDWMDISIRTTIIDEMMQQKQKFGNYNIRSPTLKMQYIFHQFTLFTVMLSIPKNKYTVPYDHLTQEFFNSLESFFNQLYTIGYVNESGAKITLGSTSEYKFSRIKHIIELYAYHPDMISSDDASYLYEFLSQNFIYYYKQYIATQGIDQENFRKYVLTLDILMNVAYQSKHLFILKKTVNNIFHTLSNTSVQTKQELINKTAAPASIKQIIKTQNELLGIVKINNRNYLYNLTRNELLSEFDQTVTKQSRVGEIILMQLTSERMYTRETLYTRAQHYILTSPNPTLLGFFSSLLPDDEKKANKIHELFIKHSTQLLGNVEEAQIINTIIDQKNIFNSIVTDLFYGLDIFYTQAQWYCYNNHRLTLLGSPHDMVITKLKSITYHEKPGVQFLVRNHEGYHIIITNFEKQDRFSLSDEEVKSYRESKSDWRFLQ